MVMHGICRLVGAKAVKEDGHHPEGLVSKVQRPTFLTLRLSACDPELSFMDESRVDLQSANSPGLLPKSG